jgi:hypothetical protein
MKSSVNEFFVSSCLTKRRPPFLRYSSLCSSNEENLKWGLGVYAFTRLGRDFALFDALLSSVYLVMHFLSSVFG